MSVSASIGLVLELCSTEGSTRLAGSPSTSGFEIQDATPPRPPSLSADKKNKNTKIPERVERLYEYGKTLEKRRQTLQEKAAESAPYTFQPRVNQSRKSSTSTKETTPKRFLLLYQDANTARRKQKEDIRRSIAESTPSFRPQINQKKVQMKQGIYKGQRFERLYKSALERQKKLEKQSSSFMPEECTFNPKTNKARISSGISGAQRLDQMYEEGKNRYRRLEEAQEEKPVFTFSPKTNSFYASQKGLRSTSQMERSVVELCPSREELVGKRESLEERKYSVELNGCTFAPKTNQRKTNQAGSKQVHIRLYNNAKERQEKHESLIEKMTAEILKTSDAVSTSSRSTASGLMNLKDKSFCSDISSKSSVFKRLYEKGVDKQYARVKNEDDALDRRNAAQWKANESECTFRPKITPNPDYVTNQESGLDSFNRLYVDAEIRKDNREFEYRVREGLDLQCTFQPKINPKSIEIINKQRYKQYKSRIEVCFNEHPTFDQQPVTEWSPKTTEIHANIEQISPTDTTTTVIEPSQGSTGSSDSSLELEPENDTDGPTPFKQLSIEEVRRLKQLAEIFLYDEI